MATADTRRVGCNFVKRRREPAPVRRSVEQDDLSNWLAESSYPTDPEKLRDPRLLVLLPPSQRTGPLARPDQCKSVVHFPEGPIPLSLLGSWRDDRRIVDSNGPDGAGPSKCTRILYSQLPNFG